MTKIGIPAFEVTEVEVPTLSNKFQDAVPGVPKISASFSVWVPAGDTALVAAFVTAAFTPPCPTYTWQITNPDGSTYAFDGFIKNNKPSDRELESLQTLDLEIRCRSFPTFTPAPTQS